AADDFVVDEQLASRAGDAIVDAHQTQAPWCVVAARVDAGHELLAGVAAFGEAHRRVDDRRTGLARNGGRVELAPQRGHANLDAPTLVLGPITDGHVGRCRDLGAYEIDTGESRPIERRDNRVADRVVAGITSDRDDLPIEL